MDINIKDFGAVGDGKTLNTEVLQKAIDECAAAGGGRITVSGGRFMTGSISLKSNIELHLASDGVLLGSGDCADYPEHSGVKHIESSLLPRWRNACLIFADECENISVTGNGTIDCNGESFVVKREGENITGWTHSRRTDIPTPPRAVFFTGCRNVKIQDVTMINQPAGWSYWIHDCDYVTFDRVKIIADVNYPNNDGIHINCSRNVTISNSSITCGDDCIIVRANSVSLKENKVCEKVVVTNCNLTSYSAGIRIGWTNDGIIRDCAFSNLVMTDTTTGVSISLPLLKPDKNNPSTADVGRESTHIENILFSNIIMDKICARPIRISLHPDEFVRCDAIKNIYFSNIHASGPQMPFLEGREDCLLENICFSDCTFDITDGSEFPNRQTHGADYCKADSFPLVARYISNLRMNNTTFSIK